MHVKGTPDLRSMTPPRSDRTTRSESIEIAIQVVEQPRISAQAAIETAVGRFGIAEPDLPRRGVERESAIVVMRSQGALARNYELADRARTHVRALLRHGSNAAPGAKLCARDALNRLANFLDNRIRYLEKIVETGRFQYRLGMDSSGQMVMRFRRADLMALSAHMVKRWGYGHCSHQASAAWFFLQDCELHGSLVEVCHFEGGDHGLVAIGRNPASNPADMRTWGQDVVVCDPWANKIYPLSALDEMRSPENDVQNFLLAPGAHYLTGTPQCLDKDAWCAVPECRVPEKRDEPRRRPGRDPVRRSSSSPW
jgi:hypothetical protein